MESTKLKVILFWILFMLGISTHSLSDLLPIIWGVDITTASEGTSPDRMVPFMMAIEYALPLIAILFIYYGKKKLPSIVNLCLAILIALFSLAHCSELFMDFSYTKLVTLPFILLVTIILVIESWRHVRTVKKS